MMAVLAVAHVWSFQVAPREYETEIAMLKNVSELN